MTRRRIVTVKRRFTDALLMLIQLLMPLWVLEMFAFELAGEFLRAAWRRAR